MFGESSKRTPFGTLANIYDGAFLWMYLTAYCFHNECSIIDVRQGYIKASGNIGIFKVKLRWRKSSRLIQRIAFSCYTMVYKVYRSKFSFLCGIPTAWTKLLNISLDSKYAAQNLVHITLCYIYCKLLIILVSN